jgi:uncharacterized protein (TIGR02246 family)
MPARSATYLIGYDSVRWPTTAMMVTEPLRREWMSIDGDRIVSEIVSGLEKAWNAADGAAFARPFAEDADFVNIRGEHYRTRDAIAKGHQAIFDTIYKGSVVAYKVSAVRMISSGVMVSHVKAILKAPTGPLAGEHPALFTIVLVQTQHDWQIAAFHNTLCVV